MEDTIYNHLKIIIKTDKGRKIDHKKAGESLLNSRQYCVICVKHGESLTLSFKSIDRMKKDFASISRKFFK